MKIPIRNDYEAQVVSYFTKEGSLQKVLKKSQDKVAKGMLTKISNILNAAGYKGASNPEVLLRQADPNTIKELERIANGLPAKERRKMLSKLYGQIGRGDLTVRRAIRDVTEFDTYKESLDLYDQGKRSLRNVTQDAMLRGEFMVQKSVGIGWQIETPGIKRVDRFLDKHWTESDATQFLKPMSRIVQDQVSQGLLMGEHPSKIAERIQNVEDITSVRANRMARTTVTAVSNEAHMESYKKHGVKRYEFRAMYNERTCDECGRLDGKVFSLDEKQPGVNFPPIHPNCRCTTGAALSKEVKDRLRENAIKNGHSLPIRDQMTFEEWKQSIGQPMKPIEEKPVKDPSPKLEGKKIVNNLNGIDLVSKERRELAVKQMDQAPDVLKRAWATNSSGLKIADTKSTNGSYYKPSTHDVHLNEKSDHATGYWWDPEKMKHETVPLYSENGVLYHELGHNMNHEYAGRLEHSTHYQSYASEFKSSKHGSWMEQTDKDGKKTKVWNGYSLHDMVEIEAKEHVDNRLKELKASAEDPKSIRKHDAYESLTKELKSRPPVESGDVSDMFEGATKGKVRGTMGHGGGKYWDHPSHLGDEAFAEMTSATMTNPESLEQIKKYFPRSYEIYMESLEAMK